MNISFTNRDGERCRTPRLRRTRGGYTTTEKPQRWFILRMERLYELGADFRMRLLGLDAKIEQGEAA